MKPVQYILPADEDTRCLRKPIGLQQNVNQIEEFSRWPKLSVRQVTDEPHLVPIFLNTNLYIHVCTSECVSKEDVLTGVKLQNAITSQSKSPS